MDILNITRSQGKIHQWRAMHENARKCIQYIPSTVNSIPTNIIENNIHIVCKVFQNILNKIYYNHTRKTVQFITAIYVLEHKILYQQYNNVAITYKLSTVLNFSS